MDDMSSPSKGSLSDDGELDSINAKVASLEEANMEVERLLRQVLYTETKAKAKLEADAEQDSVESEPFRELTLPVEMPEVEPVVVSEVMPDDTEDKREVRPEADVERESVETEPLKGLAVPDVLEEPAIDRMESKPEAKVTPQHVERLRAGTGGLSARSQKQRAPQKETGFFASIGAAVMRLLHME